MPGFTPGMTTKMRAGLLERRCANGKTPLSPRACAIPRDPATLVDPAGEPRESRRPFLATRAPRAADPHSIAGADVGLGIGRFAYSLVLPDMRDTLGWSYSAAGFMNTINAAGDLAGALMTSKLIARFGLAATARWGTLASVVSLALCALSGNFFILSFARLLAGLGAAAGFVAGAALAATIAQSRPARSIFCSVFSTPDPGSASSRRGWSRLLCCRLLGRDRGGSCGGR